MIVVLAFELEQKLHGVKLRCILYKIKAGAGNVNFRILGILGNEIVFEHQISYKRAQLNIITVNGSRRTVFDGFHINKEFFKIARTVIRIVLFHYKSLFLYPQLR